MLAERHKQYLLDSAIDLDLAEEHGVETVEGGLAFPYRSPSGRVVNVVKPDDPGDGPKYRSPKGQAPGLNVIVPEGDIVLLVEGTKQALAAASHIVPGYVVAGMNGCWGWSHNKQATPDLDIVTGKHVVVSFDADYHSNENVFRAGRALNRACRKLGALSVRLMDNGGSGSEGLDDVLARIVGGWRARHLANLIDQAVEMPDPDGLEDGYVDIVKLLTEEEPENPWLFRDVLVRGFGHVIYAPRASQKSLFTLWMLVDLIRTRDDVHVLYLDYEMGRFNLRRRLSSMGFTPDSPETQEIHARLHYWPFPDIRALDTNEGGLELAKRVEHLVSPDLDLVVVVDTTIRAVEGEENASNTIGNFTRYTAKRINAISERNGGNITWIRVDHAGKDVKKGQRGSSAKGDDVGMIWQIAMETDGILLTNEKDREGFLAHNRVRFARGIDPLRFTRVNEIITPKIEKIINLLDSAGIPSDVGWRTIKNTLPNLVARTEEIGKAQAIRRERAEFL